MRLTGVILDWAGTIVDHGSLAPVAALREVFSAAGVPITTTEARQHMGLAKRAHIASLLGLPRVCETWNMIRGSAPESNDADDLYAAFIPKQLAVLETHSAIIAGVPAAAERMRSRGLKIGTTTGYNHAMLQYVLGRARDQGFVPDNSVCPDDVPFGRPAPFMCYLNAIRLQAFPMWTLVKIGDTAADIEEGANAGMWTVGITRTGNEVGLTAPEWTATADVEKTRLLTHARGVLTSAGAQYVAESAADCDDILDRIQDRLRRGDLPRS